MRITVDEITGIVGIIPSPATRDAADVRARPEKLVWATSPMFPDGSLAKFMDYSIQLGHARFAAAGLIDPGPRRPPHLEAPANYVAGATECGRRWAVLQAEFAPQLHPQPHETRVS